ncbi:MAG: dihydroneopterin aldolase [Saprospiraceae bacterium]|nr:dihydroneopterin aldolase [Saprospiraceae bacterium]
MTISPVTINIHNLEVFAKHGFFDKERKLYQRFVLNIEICYHPSDEVRHLEDCVDYEHLVKIIEEVMKEPVMLLETLSDKLNVTILNADQRIFFSKVSISKFPLIGKQFSNIQVIRALER